MTVKEKYQQAREYGYSDQEIMEHLAKKDPAFEGKIIKAQEAGYSTEEILNYFNASPSKKEMEFGDYASDFGKQTAQGFGIGAIGTYGDIFDLLGLQAEETLPGEKAKREREFGTLERLEKGEVPSIGELEELSDDDILPRYSRLPSSHEVESIGKDAGLVSEPMSFAGRYGRRIGKIGGASLSLGATGIKAPIAAGLTGQTLEELGAPPWAQAAGEIIATLKYSPKTKSPITSKSKEVEKVIGDLRKAGYSEKDIALAKSALEERKLLKKYASHTPEAENSIQKGIKNSEELFNQQIKKGLPGYSEGGLPYLERQASNVYQTMEELASSIPIKNKEPIRKAVQGAIDYLEKYPLLDEQKKFIEFLKDGLSKLDKADTADFFTGFYRNLGKAGNWGNAKQKEHLLGMVQKGIKQTFAESGSEAAKFGKYFDKTNEVWKHWLNTRDFMETLEKAKTVEGINFKKVANILNDPENHQLANKILGAHQVENIKAITKGAHAIESLIKQIPKDEKSIHSLNIFHGLTALLKGDYKPLGALIGLTATKKLATSLLIDPEKQNLIKKLINACKNNARQEAVILTQELIKDSSQAKASEEPPQKSAIK